MSQTERCYLTKSAVSVTSKLNTTKSDLSFNMKTASQKGDKYLKALYVEFPDGSEIKGVDAFIYVWSNTEGYGWLAKLVSLPVVFTLAKILYAFLAFVLYWRFKIFNRILSS